MKYLIYFLLMSLILNYCLKNDGLVNFDVIAQLWPCYGLIALTFIFFAGAFLLFISTLCNEFSVNEEDRIRVSDSIEERQMFTCTVATCLLFHSGYYLAFSIIGFMALLREVKE